MGESIMDRAAESRLSNKTESHSANGHAQNGAVKTDEKEDSSQNDDWNIGDENEYAHFDRSAFSDCFDGRILFYLLSAHNKVLFKSIVSSSKRKHKKKKKKTKITY